ncbi:WD40-repeat-containing domain protein [Mrakia frigida]|uniref:WD40 repeat domain-containing protein n=1 Tax=Mrakia frigida TaxID=29902 RepID=UPI003FCC2612
MYPPLQLIQELPGHTDRAWHVTWSPTEPILASCSTDKTVRIWRHSTPKANEEEPKFGFQTSIATGHTRTLRSIAFSPNGRSLATASFDATVGIWERTVPEDEDEEPEWECVSTLEGHDSECKSVAWSASGGLLASCSRDKSVWIWEVQADSDFECLAVLMEHTQDVKSLAWHPHEEILASASYDDTILLLSDDPQSDWSPFQTLKSHTETVWAVVFSPCGRWLASAGDGGEMRIWERTGQTTEAPWKEVVCLRGAHSRTIYSLSWTASNSLASSATGVGRLASAGGDGRICIWQVTSEPSTPPQVELIYTQKEAHGVSDVNCVEWCPAREGDGGAMAGVLASAGDDGLVKVWRAGD